MILRAVFRSALLTLLLSAIAPLRLCAAVARPNILLILTDDQGYGDLGLHGNPVLQTPNLDRFGREGIQFDRFFVSPVCAPTRASLLTGRWWPRTGVWGVTQGKEVMRAGETTLAETLRAAGYRTGIFGKWHNGEQFPVTPLGQGFDEFFGFTGGHWNNYFDAELIRGTQPEKTKGYMADVLTDGAISFIERNRTNPFFCYVPYNTPHSPHQVPDRYFDKYTAKGCGPELAAIYGMCENIDDNVGRLLATLDRLKLRENTIVVFLTDNGPGHSDRYNAGMRGKKASVHEGGIRVPCLLQFPARFPVPRTITPIAAHIDLYPTLLELCGIKRPTELAKLDGVSLVPLLEASRASWPERFLFTTQSGGATKPSGRPGSVRSQQYRAVVDNGAEARWQLYDMVADPAQKTDIAAKHPEVTQRMAAAYEAWWRDVSADGFATPAIEVGHPEHHPVRLHPPQADLKGDVRFFIPQAFANTWITEWNDTGQVSFPLDVKSAGNFEVTLAYACAASDAGAKIRISSDRGGEAIEASAPVAAAPRIPLPHRDGPKDNYVDREWATLKVGTLSLPAGTQSLTLQSVRSATGTHGIELKHVELRQVDSKTTAR